MESGNCHHMATISKFKMAATLLDMQLTLLVVTEKVVISPFRSDGSHLVK